MPSYLVMYRTGDGNWHMKGAAHDELPAAADAARAFQRSNPRISVYVMRLEQSPRQVADETFWREKSSIWKEG